LKNKQCRTKTAKLAKAEKYKFLRDLRRLRATFIKILPHAAASTVCVKPAEKLSFSRLSQTPITDAGRPFHLLTKPVGPICNLDCKYCFYLEKEKLYPG